MSDIKKVVVIGGSASGAACAAKLRRLSEELKIVVFEKTDTPSYGSCGMPYFLGGEIKNVEKLSVTPIPLLKMAYGLDLRINTEVTNINREKKEVTAENLKTGEVVTESYDKLVFATGSVPFVPPIPGLKIGPKIFTLQNKEEMLKIASKLGESKKCGILGGGFIGLEVAEQLTKRGLVVTVIEMLPHVIPPLDNEMAQIVHSELKKNGVKLELQRVIEKVEETENDLKCTLKNITNGEVISEPLHFDFLLVSTGVRPNTSLLKDSGFELNRKGSVLVNESCQTKTDGDVYATGECVSVKSKLLENEEVYVPLANVAAIHGRMVAEHIMGKEDAKYKGSIQSGIFKCFDQYVCVMGMSEEILKRFYPNQKYLKCYNGEWDRPSYMPLSSSNPWPMTIKFLFSPEGKILGCSLISPVGVEPFAFAMSTAMSMGLNVRQLQDLELPYCPYLGNQRSSIQNIGMIATGMIDGTHDMMFMEEVLGKENVLLVDIRSPQMQKQFGGQIPGSVTVPLGKIRSMAEKWKKEQEENPKRTICLSCNTGKKSYWAMNILKKRGVKNVKSLSGSWWLYQRCYQKKEVN